VKKDDSGVKRERKKKQNRAPTPYSESGQKKSFAMHMLVVWQREMLF